jgi:hypothetical protein
MPTIREIITQEFNRRVPPSVGLTIGRVESGLNPNAKNPKSSAAGLFQIIKGTQKQYGVTDPYNPVQSARAAAQLAEDNYSTIQKGMGRPPSEWEIYMAHQQGAGGFLKLAQNPNEPAAMLIGTRAVLDNGGTQAMLSRDLLNLWKGKFEKASGITTPDTEWTGGAPPAPQATPEPVSSPPVDTGNQAVGGAMAQLLTRLGQPPLEPAPITTVTRPKRAPSAVADLTFKP